MRLKVLLPYRVFANVENITRLVAETTVGAMGILPRRLDFAAALVPGILVWETAAEGETYAAVDEGVIVKAGDDVLVSARNAVEGVDLDKLHEAVQTQFVNLNADEKTVRVALDKLEIGLVRRMMEFQHD